MFNLANVQTLVKKFAKELLIGVPIALVVAWGISYVEYKRGYSLGLENGKIAAFAEFSDDTIDLVISRNLKIDQALEAKKKENEEKFKKDKQNNEERLAEEEEKFRIKLGNLVAEQYRKELLKVQQSGFDKGLNDGISLGKKTGRQECQSACQTSIEELKSYGRLWLEFTEQIRLFEKINPLTETELRSRAEAIIVVADVGRAAATGLAKQFNSQVDEIRNALKKNDLKRVREIVSALSTTLKAKGEAYQRNYNIIVSYKF